MKLLGICAGNGVLLHPLKEYLIGNIEPRAIYHTKLNTQWNLNFQVPNVKDTDIGITGGVDIIMGHPNCGANSVLSYSRKKSLGDSREDESFNFYLKSIERYKPKIFLLENLPNLLLNISKGEFREIFRDYKLIFHNRPVSDFGNSQVNRIRLLIVGVRRDLREKRKIVSIFREVEKMNELKVCGKLLSGLQDTNESLCNVREDENEIITLYAGYRIKIKDIQHVWCNELAGKKRWPVIDRNFSTAPGVYRNLFNDYPATARKANRQFNHVGEMMTPRELARIQNIPDSFHLWYDPKKKLYCINKARATVAKTPPYDIGLWFKSRLDLCSQYLNL